MIEVTLAAIPAQSVSIQLGGSFYVIDVRDTGECVTATITRDDVTIVSGARLVPGTPVLPYRYQEAGNFILSTEGDDLPDHTQLGVTQFLVYFDAAELTAARA